MGVGPQWKDGETQERSGIMELGGATEEEEVHTYAVVGVDTSIDGRAVLYQGLDVGTPDHVNVYNELKGGTYQELDLKERRSTTTRDSTPTGRGRDKL